LWIAFKIVLLCHDLQLSFFFTWFLLGCELLSKLYFYVMIYSKIKEIINGWDVVNCFQNCTFMSWFTACSWYWLQR